MFRCQHVYRAAQVLTLAGALAALAARPAAAAEFEKTFSYDASEFTVTDLIGAVHVERASGSKFEVLVQVRGADADPKYIKLESTEGSRARLVVRFPVDEYRKYTYPALGHGSRSSFSANDRGDDRHHGSDWLRDLMDFAHGDRIEVSGRSSGRSLELWADVTVKVPASQHATVQLGCGEITAHQVAATLDLKTKSGAVHADDIKGDLWADTGSGSVEVRGVHGELTVDTGSGSVVVADVDGAKTVSIDTGSGEVRVSGIKADDLKVDTGSGSVDLTDITTENLDVDTGSGGVDGARIDTQGMKVDTGSGGLEVELVRMGHGHYRFETGSGGIRLDMPRELSAAFDASTGSGSIDADIEGVQLSRRERREAHFKVGDGSARVEATTGSGGIHLTQDAGRASRR